jgi:hypothetical protein
VKVVKMKNVAQMVEKIQMKMNPLKRRRVAKKQMPQQ